MTSVGPSLTSCNTEFNSEKDHYKSEWKIAGVPGVTEALFLTRQTTVAEEKKKSNAPPKLYTCDKGCRSSEAHAYHLTSRSHTTRVIQDGLHENTTIVKTLAPHMVNKLSQNEDELDVVSDRSDEWEVVDRSDEWEEVDGSDEWEEVDGSDEWEEVDLSDKWEEDAEDDNLVGDMNHTVIGRVESDKDTKEDEENDNLVGDTNHMVMGRVESDEDMKEDEVNDNLVGDTNHMVMGRVESDEDMKEDEVNDNLVGDTNHMVMDGEESDKDLKEDQVDLFCCFMCDKESVTVERCMLHMHKCHGFFIPDVEYLKDPRGLLTYLGLKVKRDYMCLYCNINCKPFRSLEAVKMHMVAKGHCRVHYGDGDEEEEAELDEFYDYSSSYIDGNGKLLVTADATDDGITTKAIGSREYLRYYRQKPRPSSNGVAITAVLAARNRNMGLSTVQSRENMVRMKVMKQMNRSGVEAMRTKIGMKSNVIRDLPKNVAY